MIIQCPHCQTRFKLPAAKMKTGGTKVRCTKCKSMFIVTPPETHEEDKFGTDSWADFYQDQPDTSKFPDPGQDESDFFGGNFSDDFDAAEFFGREEEKNNDYFLNGEPVPELVNEEDSPFEQELFTDAEKDQEPEADGSVLIEIPAEKKDETSRIVLAEEENLPPLPPPSQPVIDFPGDDPIPDPLPSPPRPKRSKKGMWGLLLVILLAGGYLLHSQGTVDLLLGQIQSWQKKPEEFISSGNLSPTGLSGFSVMNKKEGGLFVVQGQVVNDDVEARAGILLAGLVYNKDGAIIARQTVYGGNPMSRAELRSLSYETIMERMNNQFGEALSNINVEPKKSLPFTIVFKDVAAEVAQFGVEVIDSQRVAR